MIKKSDEKEGEELTQIYNHYLEKRKDIMNSTKFSVEDIFGNSKNSDHISGEEIQTLNKFLARLM